MNIGEDPVERAIRYIRESNLPFLGRKKKKSDLVADSNSMAAPVAPMTSATSPPIAPQTVAPQTPSISVKKPRSISYIPEDETLGEISEYIQSMPKPRKSKSSKFLTEVIREAYPPHTAIHHHSDRVADALREYIRISREYRQDLEELLVRLDRLAMILSRELDLPYDHIRPLVHTVMPLAYPERRFS